MPAPRALSAALALGVSLTLAACGSDHAAVTGPGVRATSVASDPQTATVLKRTTPLDRALSASITITHNAGGVLRLPGTGLQVVVPAGALTTDDPFTITVSAVAGDAVAYEFEPHGTVFARPLVATQALGHTTWSDNAGRTTLQAAYFAADENLDVGAGTALVSELFPTEIVVTGKRLHWDIPHFSGYVIVTGKSGGRI